MLWFPGQANALHPMATVDHSLAMVDLAGGPQNMCEKMNKAFSDGNLQWTLELADHLIISKNCVSVARVCNLLFFKNPYIPSIHFDIGHQMQGFKTYG